MVLKYFGDKQTLICKNSSAIFIIYESRYNSEAQSMTSSCEQDRRNVMKTSAKLDVKTRAHSQWTQINMDRLFGLKQRYRTI
jgi:uncharacterized protein YeaC (DUF1315 family)